MPGLNTEQVAARSKGVGGSDLPTLLGLTKKTPVQLWLEKSGRVEPKDIGNLPSVRMGHKLEAVVAECFEEETGLTCRLSNKPRTHRKYPFLVGNIDRKVQGQRAGFEAKAWSSFSSDQWGESGSSDVPLGVTAQCAHYMELHDYDDFYVGVLLGGNDFRWFKLRRDESVGAQVVTICAKFWQHVLDGTPPEVVTGEDVAKIYRVSEGFKKSTAEVEAVARQLVKIRAEVKSLESTEEKLVMFLKQFLGPVGDLMPVEGIKPIVTWRTSKDGTTTDWKGAYHELAAALAYLDGDWAWFTSMAAAARSKHKPGSRSFLVKDKIIAALS